MRETTNVGQGGEDTLAHERRAIAADIHDLVLQDLALAVASARELAEDPTCADRARPVVEAGERALAGARRVLGELRVRGRVPIVEVVEASVRAAARDTPLSFDAAGVPKGSQPDSATLHALVHIGREAVRNAVKHAAPSTVEVVLAHGDEWRLRVRDDGRGCESFGEGFGLDSITQHTYALGGSLRVASAPHAGTTLEVSLP